MSPIVAWISLPDAQLIKRKRSSRRRCILRAEHLPISWLFIVTVDGAEEEKYVVEERRSPVVRQASN